VKWSALVVLLAGCFSPRAPSGVICDPLAPRCPDGQVCRAEAGGHVCKAPGGDEPDASTDALDPFAYLTFAPGYAATVFQDYSASYTFDAMDWMEATEVHDNHPAYAFALQSPFPQALGVIAGREILVLDGTRYEAHDYGNHAPNAGMGQPDNLTGAQFVANLDNNGPALLVSSGSEDAGDGAFRITPLWAISIDLSVNNTRSILNDATGAFDARMGAERYLGSQNGIVRRSDQVLFAAGDTRSMRVVGNDLYITRFTGMAEQLIRIASGTHTEFVLATRTRLRIAEGPSPVGVIAWAVVDGKQLVQLHASGKIDVLAEVTDPAYVWTSAVVPPPGHPLAGRVYVLESNRARDLDRVLAITTP
jgi:hypothetical protein